MPDSGNSVGANREVLPSCSRWLSLEDFPLNRHMHLGRGSWCRDCVRRATEDWRQRNRERVNAERRVAYREQHPLPERPCIVCGEPFGKRADALVCGERCRNQRKDEQRKAAGLMPTT